MIYFVSGHGGVFNVWGIHFDTASGKPMAADPEVFAWYIKDYGPDANLFVDHSRRVQQCLRSAIWETKGLWRAVVEYKT
jgi:(2R)-phospho-3-sulfolactate synthase (ComA)